MPQAVLGSAACLAQGFFLQRLMNGYRKMTNVPHFNTIVGASCNELRHRLTLQGATDKDKRDLPLRSVQEFQCLRFPPIGAGILGDNKVIGVRAQPLAELFGSSDDLSADREMHLVEALASSALLPLRDLNKEDVQRQMSAFRSAKDVSIEAGM